MSPAELQRRSDEAICDVIRELARRGDPAAADAALRIYVGTLKDRAPLSDIIARRWPPAPPTHAP